MKKSQFWIVAVVCLVLPSSLLAHGHYKWAGAWAPIVGSIANGVEGVKHAGVVTDQIFGPPEERSYVAIVSNIIVGVAHVYHVGHHAAKIRNPENSPARSWLGLATAVTILDFAVDTGIEGFYLNKEFSLKNLAVMGVTGVSMLLNLENLKNAFKKKSH